MKRRGKKPTVFKDWLKDYLKNSTVAGFVYYVAPGTRPRDRLFWTLVHVICVISLILMIFETTFEYTRNPAVTSPELKRYPIQNMHFPGVAICYVNKVNYSAALELATDILQYKYVGNLTTDDLTGMLKYLGHLYLFTLDESEKETIDLLHELLIRRYKHYVPYVMKKIAPDVSCRWMLQHCSWGGKERICDDLFLARITADGYCCTFNYVRKSDAFEGKKSSTESWGSVETLYPQAIGSQFGLTVLVRRDLRNHFYKILPTRGYKILVFPPLDFPDAASGGLREILIAPRTENLLSLDATPFYSVPTLSRFSVAERGCLFNDELSLIFGGYYSYSDCIMYCRIADIKKLCDCIPFFYPKDGDSLRFCDLKDLPCLNKYRERWTRVNPTTGYRSASFPSQELSSGLNCSECFPACKDILYKVSVSSTPMTATTVRTGKDIYKFASQSIIHVFFKRPDTIRLKQDVLHSWYDLMSNYGGICGLFLGVSIISVAEFVYFFTVRLLSRKNESDRSRALRSTLVEAMGPALPPLYWKELVHPK